MNGTGSILRPPVFDPGTALGWNDIALDGLSCYLRCVEAVLGAYGNDDAQVADALATPLRLICDDAQGRPGGTFPGCDVEWRSVPPGESLWDELTRILDAGEFAVVSPDSYWWPGDELRGRLHGHHHMVLPVAIRGGEMEFLDTDAPAEDGYRARLPCDDPLRLTVNTIGHVRVRTRGGFRPLGADPDRALAESAAALSADTAEFRRLAERWQAEPPTPMLARALHVMVLGEVQPPLFLFASALERLPHLAPVTAAAYAAAAAAKKFGILLTGLHRFDSATLYQICWGELDAMIRALDALSVALSEACGPAAGAAEDPPGRLAARLSGIELWCFDQAGKEAVRWLAGPR